MNNDHLTETEQTLLARIEQIEGRVPTNQEVARYGLCTVHPNGVQAWTWKGTLIVQVKPAEMCGGQPLVTPIY